MTFTTIEDFQLRGEFNRLRYPPLALGGHPEWERECPLSGGKPKPVVEWCQVWFASSFDEVAPTPEPHDVRAALRLP